MYACVRVCLHACMCEGVKACVQASVQVWRRACWRVCVRAGVEAWRNAGVLQAGLKWCGSKGVGIVCVLGGDDLAS